MAETNEVAQVLWDATLHSMLYGHGFVRVSYNNGNVEVKHIVNEDLEELLKFMKENKHVDPR